MLCRGRGFTRRQGGRAGGMHVYLDGDHTYGLGHVDGEWVAVWGMGD
jgi:hypothetical protein